MGEAGLTATTLITYLVGYVVAVVLPLIVMYYIVKFAVLNALREHYDETHPQE